MSTIAIAGAHRSTRPLILTHWREMSRNRANFYFVLIFPFLMAGIFLGLNKILSSSVEGSGPDFSTLVVPFALCLGLTGTCMTLTSGPIAEYRQHGHPAHSGHHPGSRAAVSTRDPPGRSSRPCGRAQHPSCRCGGGTGFC